MKPTHGPMVRIEVNRIVSERERQQESDNVINVLTDLCGEIWWHEFASRSAYDVVESYAPTKIKDAALCIFGTDWPCAVEALKTRKIIVEGFCPDCGEELEEVAGYTRYDHVLGCISSEMDGYYRCPKCNYESDKR